MDNSDQQSHQPEPQIEINSSQPESISEQVQKIHTEAEQVHEYLKSNV